MGSANVRVPVNYIDIWKRQTLIFYMTHTSYPLLSLWSMNFGAKMPQVTHIQRHSQSGADWSNIMKYESAQDTRTYWWQIYYFHNATVSVLSSTISRYADTNGIKVVGMNPRYGRKKSITGWKNDMQGVIYIITSKNTLVFDWDFSVEAHFKFSTNCWSFSIASCYFQEHYRKLKTHYMISLSSTDDLGCPDNISISKMATFISTSVSYNTA